MRFALVDRGDIHSQRLACELRKKLEAITWQEDAEYPERIFCIGGDGTMLRAIHEYIDQLDTVFRLVCTIRGKRQHRVPHIRNIVIQIAAVRIL